MNARKQDIARAMILALIFLGADLAFAKGPPVDVQEAVPNYGNQGEFNKAVKIKGKGFDSESTVEFLLTGTENPGNVTVQSVTYDPGTGDLDTIIDVPDGETAATLGDYDIRVTNSRGRKGKGTTLFAVLKPGETPGPNNEGLAISMLCSLDDEGDALATMTNDEAVNSPDGSPYYEDALDKVGCISAGVSGDTLAGLRLRTVVGSLKRAVRFVDMKFEQCLDGTDCVPAKFLDPSKDSVQIDVHPYPDSGHDHIHLMDPGEYWMYLSVRDDDLSDRYIVQMAQRDSLPEGFLQSINCHYDAPGYPSLEDLDDIKVYIWEDGIYSGSADGLPDGYTVTTGLIDQSEALGALPVVTPMTASALICSNVDENGDNCGPKKNSQGLCAIRGQVGMRFTLHMEYE